MDTASAQSADLSEPLPPEARAEGEPGASPAPAPGCFDADLYKVAAAGEVELSAVEFAQVLYEVGSKHNFGLDAGVEAAAAQQNAFLRVLHLRELALARACALGREAAWTQFMAEFRAPLTRAAIAVADSTTLGEELADSLYSELFGLTERQGVRWSPLSTYSGRGSLMGWLRAMLAQRFVNHFRRTHRETALDEVEVAAHAAAQPEQQTPEQPIMERLNNAVTETLAALGSEDRFLLAAYYLDRHTLLELSRVLRVHEATVSRKLKRLTGELRKRIFKSLQTGGMSRRAAQEAMGAAPEDLNVNLRKLLQTPAASAFFGKEGGS